MAAYPKRKIAKIDKTESRNPDPESLLSFDVDEDMDFAPSNDCEIIFAKIRVTER